MRIGFDAKRLYNNFTGLGNYSRTLVANFSRYFPDHHLCLYTPKVHAGLEISESSSNVHTFVSNHVFPSLWRSNFLLKQLERDKIDLYHGLSHELPMGIQKSFVKSVVSVHDLIFKYYPNTYSLIDRCIYNLKFRYSCLHSDRIVAISENTKRDIVQYYHIEPHKIKVIYPTALPLYYKPLSFEKNFLFDLTSIGNVQLSQNYLLYVGSVIPRKNLATIVKCYQYLPKDLQIPLVVVGKGRSYKRNVQKLIRELKLDHLVIWIDNLHDNEQLRWLYHKAKILIYPSLYEGFGLPVVEALLSKCSVLTTKGSSLEEAGEAYAHYLHNPLDAQEMAFQIQKILENAKQTKKIREAGYVYAKEKFDPKKISRMLFDLYMEVAYND